MEERGSPPGPAAYWGCELGGPLTPTPKPILCCANPDSEGSNELSGPVWGAATALDVVVGCVCCCCCKVCSAPPRCFLSWFFSLLALGFFSGLGGRAPVSEGVEESDFFCKPGAEVVLVVASRPGGAFKPGGNLPLAVDLLAFAFGGALVDTKPIEAVLLE